MALEGSLSDFGLADILQLIYFQRKTGVLVLEGGMDKVRLLFVEGNIVGAESKRRKDDNRIGKILLKKGLVAEDKLSAALEEQERTGAKLGNILVSEGLADREKITEILKGQITETVIELFGWKQGAYTFSSQGVPQDKELAFSIDTQHLLMEGLRILDEWSLIKGKIALDTVFRQSGLSGDLTAEEGEVLSHVDGETDVSTIIDLSPQDNFVVSKTLLTLMENGFIEVVEAEPMVAAGSETGRRRRFTVPGLAVPVAVVLAFVFTLALVLSQKKTALKEFTAAQKIEELRFRIDVYETEHSRYPASLDAVGTAVDPWGRPFLYKASGNTFTVFSLGEDGIEGTGDDIF